MVSLAEQYQASEAVARPAAVSTSIDNILRLAMNGGPARTAARAKPSAPPDFTAAVDVLDRASQALSVLQTRCTKLEADLAAERQRYAGEVQAAIAQAKEWERRATSVKAQLYDSESLLTEAELRAEAAVRRADAAEARVAEAEQRAAETTEQARLYHDKIMGVFAAQVA